MIKQCTVCKITKSYTDFYFRDRSAGRLHSQCKECYKTKRIGFMEEHYAKYGDEYRTRARIRKMVQKSDRQEKITRYLKDKHCEVCGISDIRVLDFDHLDQKTKKFSIARGLNNGWAWDVILEEIQKCRILCANCHRIRTAEQQNSYKWRLGRVV
jgi:hypothetical protein